MDLGSALVGLIIIVICIVPFVIMSQGNRKTKKQKLAALEHIAHEQNCSISQHDVCGDFVIGFDDRKKHVFFYKEYNDKKEETFVDLAHVKDCKIIKEDKRINNKSGAYSIIDKLNLSFKTTNNKEIRMEFYNSDVNLQLSGELQMIEKWKELIKSSL